MIRIETWIRPHQVEVIKAALRDAGASGVTVCDVWIESPEPGGSPRPRVKVEVVVHDDVSERVLAGMVHSAGAHGIGDVWLVRVSQAVRICTGEIDEAAIAY